MVAFRAMHPTRRLATDVGVALVGVVIAYGVRLLLAPLWGYTPLLPYVPAVGIAAWLAGRRSGLIATGLGGAAAVALWMRATPAPLDVGHVTGLALFVAIGVLLSLVIQARQDVEERFRHLAEHIDACFWVTDAAPRRVRYGSPSCQRLWGFAPEEFYRDPRRWVAAIHEEDRARAEAAFVDRVGREAFDEMYRMVTPAKGVRWIRDRGFPVRDRARRVRTLVRVAQDVTERV